MTPDIERFLDLATRPLEDVPGERDEAKGELMSRIGHGGVPYEMLDLAGPITALERTKPAKPALRRSILASSAILLTTATIAATAFLAWEIVLTTQASIMSARSPYGGTYVTGADHLPVLNHVRAIAPDLPLGLHPEAGGSAETSAALAKNPGDLAMLQEHVLRRLRNSSTRYEFPSEDREIIDRLDADNALWPLIRITPSLSKATGTSAVGYGYRSTGSIVSVPDFEEARRLFSEAASKSAYFDRSESLQRRQMDAFPTGHSLSESVIATGFVELVSPPFGYYTGSLGSLAELQTKRLTGAGDKEGLRRFYLEWKQISKLVASSPESGQTGHGSIFFQLIEVGRFLGDAFGHLGMAVEKAEVEERMKLIESLTASSHSLSKEVQQVASMRLHSESRTPKDLTVGEALPSRLVELSFFDRIIASVFSCVALFFAGLVAFEACRRSRVVKAMARGLMPLFRRVDHAWIAGLGLLLPWLWWFGISRISPLGWRDGNLDDGWPVLVTPVQSTAALILAAVLLLHTARWRWSLRGGFIGLGVSLPWIGWGVAAITALSIPAAGALRYFESSLSDEEKSYYMLAVAGMAVSGLLWLLWQGVMTLFTPRSGALRPNLTMRVALPWTLTGLATLLASLAISTMLERHWFAKDPLFPSWTSETHVNALKERLTKETREAARGL